MATRARMIVERIIVSSTIRALLSAGYLIDVSDGEDDVLADCTDHNTIIKAMFSTDEDVLFAVKDGKRRGWIRFVYGNNGFDVMSDYTLNLDHTLQPVNDLANQLESDPLAVLDWATNSSALMAQEVRS